MWEVHISNLDTGITTTETLEKYCELMLDESHLKNNKNLVNELVDFNINFFQGAPSIEIKIKSNTPTTIINTHSKLVEEYRRIICDSYKKNIESKEVLIIEKLNLKIPFIALDLINFLGLRYVRKIETINAKDMKLKYNNQPNFAPVDAIKKEYIHRRNNQKTSETWFFHCNGYENLEDRISIENLTAEFSTPKQTVDIEPSFLEMMTLFDSETRTIYVCEENINKTIYALHGYDNWFNQDNFETLKEIMILNSIGHSVFKYLNEDSNFEENVIINNTRCNYLASLMTKGKYDYQIKCITHFQPFENRFPLLVSAFSPNEKEKFNQKVGDLYVR